MTKKIPEGYNTVTPSLMFNNAAKAIKLYEKALGAKEIYRAEMPDGSGKIMHACIQIGDSKIFLADIHPKMGDNRSSVSSFYVYLDDVDAITKQAKQAGLNELQAPQDMFYGDRISSLRDEFGISWTLATHVRDVSDEEMEEAKKKWAKAAA